MEPERRIKAHVKYSKDGRLVVNKLYCCQHIVVFSYRAVAKQRLKQAKKDRGTGVLLTILSGVKSTCLSSQIGVV